jgi:hypothetical protein
MTRLSYLALALSGALALPAGAYAAGAADSPTARWQNVAAGLDPTISSPLVGGQREVIEPPMSIDPGMTIDPPQIGARMPILRPPGAIPGGALPR